MPPFHSQRLRIIVLGYVVRGRYGGMAWHYFQYLTGLSQLGHDVYFVEDSTDKPFCHHPKREIQDTDPSEGLKFAFQGFKKLGFADRWAYYDAHTSRWTGPCADRIQEICKTADLLINVSGWVNPMRPWLFQIPVRAYIDTDPLYTQVRHLTERPLLEEALQHTVFFSFGENIGERGCEIPDDGISWQPTRQPVALDRWLVTPGPDDGKITTVMAWDSFGAMEYQGQHYGMKCDSFEEFVDLPQLVGPMFEVQSRLIPASKMIQLMKKGWTVKHAHDEIPDPWSYRDFIQRSKAELGIAKHGYVIARGGWFSERSAVYLASGRPVLAQQTGFSEWLLADRGVIPFQGKDDLVQSIEELNRRYEVHCRAAREVAEEYFAADKVLESLVERAMNHPTGTVHERTSRLRSPGQPEIKTEGLNQQIRLVNSNAQPGASTVASLPPQSAFQLAMQIYTPYLQLHMPHYNLGAYLFERLRDANRAIRMLGLGAASVTWALPFGRSESHKLNIKLVDPVAADLELIQKVAWYEGFRVDVEVSELDRAPLDARTFDIVVCRGSLKACKRLDHVFGQIREALAPGGELWVLDEPIGRNSSVPYPETLEIAQGIFNNLPSRLRRDPVTDNVDSLIQGGRADATTDGPRSEEVLPLLCENFRPVEYVTYDAFLSLLLGFRYGPNYDTTHESDEALVELITEMDMEFVGKGILKPTVLLGIFK